MSRFTPPLQISIVYRLLHLMANYIQKITMTKMEHILPLPSLLASQPPTIMLSEAGLRKLRGTSFPWDLTVI